jgi:hypothetical protein
MPFTGPRLTSAHAAIARPTRAKLPAVTSDSAPGPAPIDDGWEPERERPTLGDRIGGGPVEYFRAVPSRLFAWLGTIIFVGGWAAAVYIAFSYDVSGGLGSNETANRLQILVSHGTSVTIAAGILWGVAAFLWVKVLPTTPDDGPEAA